LITIKLDFIFDFREFTGIAKNSIIHRSITLQNIHLYFHSIIVVMAQNLRILEAAILEGLDLFLELINAAQRNNIDKAIHIIDSFYF
jgi:hypothetical protein